MSAGYRMDFRDFIHKMFCCMAEERSLDLGSILNLLLSYFCFGMEHL